MKYASVLVPRGIAAMRVALQGETALPQKAQGKRGMRGIKPSPWESLQQLGSIPLIPACPLQPQSSGGKRGLQARCCSTAKAERVQTHRPGRFGQGDGNNLGVGEGNVEILHGQAQRGDSPQGGTVLSRP